MSIRDRKTALIRSIEKMDERLFIQVEKLLSQAQENEHFIELVNRALSSEKDIAAGKLISLDDAETLLDQHVLE